MKKTVYCRAIRKATYAHLSMNILPNVSNAMNYLQKLNIIISSELIAQSIDTKKINKYKVYKTQNLMNTRNRSQDRETDRHIGV